MLIGGVLREQIDRVHTHTGIEIVAGGIEQKPLNAWIAEGTVRFLRRNSVIFHRNLIRSRLLHDGADSAD